MFHHKVCPVHANDIPREARHEVIRRGLLALFGKAHKRGEKPKHPVGAKSTVTDGTKVEVAIAFGEASPIGVHEEGDVGIGRGRVTEEPLEVHLASDRPKEVVAAYHLGYPHESVIHHHSKLVGNNAVASANEKVAAFACEHLGVMAIDRVV